MTQAERALLVYVAKVLGQLLIWRNIDGRTDGLAITKLAEKVEAEGACGVEVRDAD